MFGVGEYCQVFPNLLGLGSGQGFLKLSVYHRPLLMASLQSGWKGRDHGVAYSTVHFFSQMQMTAAGISTGRVWGSMAWRQVRSLTNVFMQKALWMIENCFTTSPGVLGCWRSPPSCASSVLTGKLGHHFRIFWQNTERISLYQYHSAVKLVEGPSNSLQRDQGTMNWSKALLTRTGRRKESNCSKIGMSKNKGEQLVLFCPRDSVHWKLSFCSSLLLKLFTTSESDDHLNTHNISTKAPRQFFPEIT